MYEYLILEDGTIFTGSCAGSQREVISEIVFNTSMTGYLEVMTDPSYAGQAVVMTYPLIGNYGMTPDAESRCPWLDGLIVRELCDVPSNFRCEGDIRDYLKKNDIPALEGIDTRALTRLLRDRGTMNGCLTTKRYEGEELQQLLERIRAYRVTGVVAKTSVPEPCLRLSALKGADGETRTRFRVAFYDLGVKENILRELCKRGCEVTVWPYNTPAETVLASNPDGIMLSNGPGDPKENVAVIAELKKLYERAEMPIFAICLGHQLMALALGGDTYKLKYGHRGGNHPVRDLVTGRVYITSQNHGYAVDDSSLPASVAVPAMENVNDGTNEGLFYKEKDILTVQYHPEACPGPRDSSYLFDRFIARMEAYHA